MQEKEEKNLNRREASGSRLRWTTPSGFKNSFEGREMRGSVGGS